MARSFLRYLLNEQGRMQWANVIAAGAEHEHSPATLREVRHEVAEKFVWSGHWYWQLKEDRNG